MIYTYYRCTKKLAPCTQRYVSESSLEAQLRKAISDVGIPPDVAAEWEERMEQDATFEKSSAFSSLSRIENEFSNIEKKLSLLLDGYLDGTVDAASYKSKKNEFFEKKIKLSEEKAKLESGEVTWLEPMREYIKEAANAAKSACAKNNCSDLVIIAKKVGSNCLIVNGELTLTHKMPYSFFCAPANAQQSRDKLFWAGFHENIRTYLKTQLR